MGKIVVLAVIVVLAASQGVYAGWFDSGTSSAPAAATTAAPAAGQSVSPTKGASTSPDLLEKMKANLDNTQWTVTVNSMNGQGQVQQDTLTFANGQMDSQNMEKIGYASSNFSVRLLANATLVWETMKTAKAGTVFWRGDIGPDGTMHGVISNHDNKNGVSNSGFLSVSSKKIAAPKSASAQTAPASAKTAPAPAQTLDSEAASSN